MNGSLYAYKQPLTRKRYKENLPRDDKTSEGKSMQPRLFIVNKNNKQDQHDTLKAFYSEMEKQSKGRADAQAGLIRQLRERICGDSFRSDPLPAA